ncbi:MAG: hypothetical protein ACOCWI_01315 [Bacillota bacterium]
MKKNWFLRIATLVIVLTVATACLVSGTFARYVTTETGNDLARVAAWGVEITATDGETFVVEDGDLGEGEFAFQSGDTDDILAPGMSGGMLFEYNGTPEVGLDIEYTVTGDGYTGDWTEDGTTEYKPLIFTATYQLETGTDETICTDVSYDAFVTDLESFYNFYAAGEDLSEYSLLIEWEWPTDSGNDVGDTYLGDLETAPEFELEVGVAITQQTETQGFN